MSRNVSSKAKACVTCHERRVKCDGQRPCTACVERGHGRYCEYRADGPTVYGGLQAEEQRLTRRANALESAVAAARSSTGSSSNSGGFARSTSTRPWWDHKEPPLEDAQYLIGHFIAHASEFGLFLEPNRFMDSVFHASRYSSRPSDALMAAVYLWGVRLSQDPHYTSKESLLLDRAQHAVSTALSHRGNIIHAIQAEILLTTYLIETCKFPQATQHLDSAFAICTGSGFQQLSLAGDPSTVGESIHAWWTVVAMDKVWAATLQRPSAIGPQIEAGVVTPWPYELAVYKGQLGSTRPVQTLTAFLGNPSAQIRPSSRLELYVKAAILFEWATRLSSHHRSGMRDTTQYREEFQAVDRGIACLIISLTSGRRPSPGSARTELAIHNLAHAATIQLHKRFTRDDETSRQKCSHAGMAVVARILELAPGIPETRCNPILGTVWEVVCQALISDMNSPAGATPYGRTTWRQHLAGQVQTLMSTMQRFGGGSPLMAWQLSVVQQAR